MKKAKFLISGIGPDTSRTLGSTPLALSVVKVLKAIQLLALSPGCRITKFPAEYRRLVPNPEFIWPRCTGLLCPIDCRPSNMFEVDGITLNIEPNFCHLVDMLC